MKLIPISKEHYGRIAELHRECYAGDFLPGFGPRFLVALYEAMFKAEAVFGFVGVVGEEIVGFCVFTPDSSNLFPATLKKGFFKLALFAGLKILRSPATLKNILATSTYGSRAALSKVKAEMMLWGVDPKRRGQGLGRKLWEACEREIFRKGFDTYKVTVYADNEAANGFYRKKGHELAHEFELYGRKWNLYLGRIDPGLSDRPRVSP